MYRVEFTDKDKAEFLKLSQDGAIAVFLYTANVFVNGKIEKYDDGGQLRALALGGVAYVPECFFEKILCGKVEHRGGAVRVTLDSKVTEVPDTYVKDGNCYLPLISTANALGLRAKSYYENRLTVLGKAAHIEAMDSSPLLEEAASYLVFGDYVTDGFTSADYTLAKDLWRLRLVGSPEINDMSDEFVRDKIKAVDEKCEEKWASMNKRSADGEDPVILWGDSAPTESGELSRQYGGIFDLANSYGTAGSRFYKNEDLLSDIIYGLDWMYEHMYGEAEMQNKGWRDVFAFNWWFWHVGGPEHLTNTLLIIEDKLTMADKKKYLKCYEWVRTVMRTGPNRACASSRLKCGTKTALLLEDPELLKSSQEDCDTLFGIEEDGEGPHKDYVQWTHGFPHNISYALGNLQRTLYTSSILAKTPLDFSGPKKYNQFMLLKYTFEPAMYLGQGFVMFSGRSVAAAEMDQGAAVVAGLLPMIGVYGDDEDAYIKRMIKRHCARVEMQKKVRRHCSLYDLSVFNEIIADASIPSDNSYEYAHAWYTGDRAAQHRNNYAVGLAISSEREVTYESINDANKSGWYTGDGAHYLYTDYDDGQFDGKNFIEKNINVAYRFPGTTEDSQPRVIRSILNPEAWRNPTAFAGSMQIEDKYILCGMDFIAMHFEGPDKNIVDTGYGAGLAVHHNDLVAKKAYFCFDDEIVALGAGITSTMNSDVHTTVEHRRIVNDDKYDQFICWQNGVEKLMKDPYEKTGVAKWALMQGHSGYVFLGGAEAYVGRYVCPEANNQSYFELRVEHGKNPQNAGYAYAILPYADEEKIQRYSASPDVEILFNTARVQAVCEKNLGIRGFVFHEPYDAVGIVSASVPSLVTIVERDGEIDVYVCDPTHKLETGEFILPGELSLISSNSKLKVSARDGKTVIKADFFGAHGRTYIAKFKK